MSKRQEFNFGMTCEGCSGAAKRNLKKIGVEEENVEADLSTKKLYVTTDKPVEELLEALKKTGKDVVHVPST